MTVNTFLEKIYSHVEGENITLRTAPQVAQEPLMKSDAEAAESFARYLKFWTKEHENIVPSVVESRAQRKGAQVSNSKVTTAINGEPVNHRMRILEAIAIGINRPPEEVFLAALGYFPTLTDYPEFKESDFAHLWHVYSQLPLAERKVYKRFVQMLANDMQRTYNKTD